MPTDFFIHDNTAPGASLLGEVLVVSAETVQKVGEGFQARRVEAMLTASDPWGEGRLRPW